MPGSEALPAHPQLLGQSLNCAHASPHFFGPAGTGVGASVGGGVGGGGGAGVGDLGPTGPQLPGCRSPPHCVQPAWRHCESWVHACPQAVEQIFADSRPPTAPAAAGTHVGQPSFAAGSQSTFVWQADAQVAFGFVCEQMDPPPGCGVQKLH